MFPPRSCEVLETAKAKPPGSDVAYRTLSRCAQAGRSAGRGKGAGFTRSCRCSAVRGSHGVYTVRDIRLKVSYEDSARYPFVNFDFDAQPCYRTSDGRSRCGMNALALIWVSQVWLEHAHALQRELRDREPPGVAAAQRPRPDAERPPRAERQLECRASTRGEAHVTVLRHHSSQV